MFYKKTSYAQGANILDSEVGLVLKTCQATDSMATNGVIKKGTVLPSNNGNAVGICFEDVDMSNDTKRPISIIVAGRIIEANLPASVESTAKAVLTEIVFV